MAPKRAFRSRGPTRACVAGRPLLSAGGPLTIPAGARGSSGSAWVCVGSRVGVCRWAATPGAHGACRPACWPARVPAALCPEVPAAWFHPSPAQGLLRPVSPQDGWPCRPRGASRRRPRSLHMLSSAPAAPPPVSLHPGGGAGGTPGMAQPSAPPSTAARVLGGGQRGRFSPGKAGQAGSAAAYPARPLHPLCPLSTGPTSRLSPRPGGFPQGPAPGAGRPRWAAVPAQDALL